MLKIILLEAKIVFFPLIISKYIENKHENQGYISRGPMPIS